ncbi:MAG: gamma-glutamyl-gamma-aminobutyrate hydrolase family protein [Ktedonobacterales bacterium]|nr:gamma-glutamyl-gamma-aminobutyrate hydrolase family protein [Ktedonobacterales bacterium]
MRPVIGIPCYEARRADNQRPLYGNNISYVRAVERAGGLPLLIPPLQDADALVGLADRLDGLLLSGGGDLAPAHYGESPRPECGVPEVERDVTELALARHALLAKLPVLGICRGHQVLNVALGGTLYQDISTALPEARRHDCHDRARDYRAHSIEIEPGSRLAAMLGTRQHAVNSLHHQALHRLGEGVRVLARAEDGIIEAIEVRGHPFALAVQFHPEELAPADEPSQRLFSAFVRACQR